MQHASQPCTDQLDDEERAAAVLACLPEMTPSRLDRLLASAPSPTRVVAQVQAGRSVPGFDPLLVERWSLAARHPGILRTLERRATRAYVRSQPGYPIVDDVPDRPPVLLAEGAGDHVWMQPRVAVVGTRAATPHGLADAREIGMALATAGVTVVSGLAIGIDGAAHEGALDAGGAVVGVVATGLDVVYPRRHGVLFERVRAHGLLVGETGYGIGPHPSRFPVRNRIIAALADVVVVVEATERGGARITAERALDYGRPVLAMPGSRRNPSAAGTNALLADGAHPLLHPDDVLLALGLTPGRTRASRRPTADLTTDQRAALHACAGEPATIDEIASRSGLSPGATARALRELEASGGMTRAHGFWWPQ